MSLLRAHVHLTNVNVVERNLTQVRLKFDRPLGPEAQSFHDRTSYARGLLSLGHLRPDQLRLKSLAQRDDRSVFELLKSGFRVLQSRDLVDCVIELSVSEFRYFALNDTSRIQKLAKQLHHHEELYEVQILVFLHTKVF